MMHIRTLGAAMLLVAALPSTGRAQSAVAASPSDQQCQLIPSLGIDGISCQNCSFSFAGGRRSATFSTEPRIIRVDPDGPASGILRAGDVLVAIDGQLITTRRGGEAFSSYRVGETVGLRLRRDGRERDVQVVAGEACVPEPPAPPAPPRAVEPGMAPSASAAPRPRSPARAGSPPRAPTPTSAVSPPSPPSAPSAVAEPVSARAGRLVSLSQGLPPLGIGLSCSDCSVEMRGSAPAWSFSSPPSIRSVEPGSPADDAGLRSGDRLIRVDGLDIDSERGGERLARLEPGRRVTLGLERGGVPIAVSFTVPDFDPRPVPLPSTAPTAAVAATATPMPVGPLRQVSRLGDVDIEVRGEGAVYIEEGDFVIIRSPGLEVRLRRRPGG